MNFIINHVPPRQGDVKSSTGSGLLDLVTATINDKWTVEALKEYLRKRRGTVSAKKADLLERFVFVNDGAINIIDNNIAQS